MLSVRQSVPPFTLDHIHPKHRRDSIMTSVIVNFFTGHHHRHWTVESAHPIDQQLMDVVDPHNNRRKPIWATDTPDARAPAHPPTTSSQIPPRNLDLVPPATIPPRGQAQRDHVHTVPLDSDIGQQVVLNHTRAQDERTKQRKHHLTHSGMLWGHPELVIQHLWDVVKQGGGYVVWNYTDFYNHFVTWKGSYVDLLTDLKFMWRALVTAMLTIGLIEIMPLLEGLGRLLWDVFYVLRMAFGLIERTSEELFAFLTVLWDDAVSLVQRLTTG